MTVISNSTVAAVAEKTRLFGRCRAATAIALFLSVVPVYAADDARRWNWSILLGLASWSGLANLESASGGSFDSLGFALELAGHKNVARWGSADILVGADLGLFTTDSDIRGFSEEYTQRGLYLTPSVKFRFGERSKRYMNLEAGLGWYNTDFAELDCDTGGYVCVELVAPFDSDTVGGYVGISGGFGRWLVAGLRVHYADFGPVTGIGSLAGDLKGPFYIFSLGAAFGG
jgi:hypothetical protein